MFGLDPMIIWIFGGLILHWLFGLLGAFHIHDVYHDDPAIKDFAELYWLLLGFGVIIFGFLMLLSYLVLPAPKREQG